MNGRKVLLIVAIAVAVGAFAWWRRADREPRVPARAAGPVVGAPVAGGEPGGPAPAPGEAERVRARWREMTQALEKVRSEKRAVPSPPTRRPGEPDAVFEERQRALADYRKFVDDVHVAPDRDEAIRRALLDAQENWQRALE